MSNAAAAVYHCKFDELVDPSTLKDHPRNANRHPRRQLDALVKFIEFSGWRHPIVVSNLSGFIVAGHARKIAAIERGDLAPVEYQDFESEEAERAMLLADNHLAELADMDIKLQSIEIAELKSMDVPMESFGFAPKSRPSADRDRLYIVEAFCSSEDEQTDVFNMLQENGTDAKMKMKYFTRKK